MSRPRNQSRQNNQGIRPLPSQLSRSLGKEIFIATKLRYQFFKGILRVYDMHLNLVISNAKEITKHRDGTTTEKQYKTIILRGDSIKFVETTGTRIMISNEDKESEI